MPVSTRKQIRDHVIEITKQDSDQISSLVNDFINETINEINNPGWAFPGGEYNHLWSFLRRRTTFATVASQADYVMERDVDKIAILTQRTTPTKLVQVPDEIFLREIPNPTETGSPSMYRLWAIDGVSTKLAAADTIDVVSSSSSDGSSFTAGVFGYISGRLTSETYTMNGSTAVAGSKSFDAREIFVSKSAKSTGNFTFTENSGGTTLIVLGPEDTAPRMKVVTLYPIPSSAITMYLEYYKRMRELVNDVDVPEFDQQFHYIVKLGALAKTYQFLGKTEDYVATHGMYANSVRSMVAADKTEPDLINHLRRRTQNFFIRAIRSETLPS